MGNKILLPIGIIMSMECRVGVRVADVTLHDDGLIA